MESTLSRGTSVYTNAISYIKSVATMKNDDLDDMLDGINSYNLSQHITTMKTWKNIEEWNTFCDGLISLTNQTYSNRFKDYHIIFQELVALRTGCEELVNNL
jgi:hypothetical protein